MNIPTIKPCSRCGEHCYEIELSDEGRTWGPNFGEPIPEWVDTFRLWRTCSDDDDDDEYVKDDNRTGWYRSMGAAAEEWNEMFAEGNPDATI